MNRPRNVELMQKRCITKKRNFTEDRPLRRWRLWSGNSRIINIRTPLECDYLSIESCNTFSEQLNYYLMTGFSQFASLIWSVFICILWIVTLSNLIVFFSFCQHKQQTAATTGSPWCFGLCYEESRSRCGKQFESIDWHSLSNLHRLFMVIW